jgi:hypothetical protein
MKLHLLQLAGLLHFAILIASASVPRLLGWRTALPYLPRMLRQLFWVYGAFIVMVIIGFGTLTLVFAPALAAGDALARGLCALIAVFWLARLTVQLFVFDLEPYLTRWWLRLGSHGLTLAFTYFALVYGASALLPGDWVPR